MPNKMKKGIFNHIWLKLLSLSLAFILWFVVMNVEDSAISKTIYDIPVQMNNGDTILKSGGVYDITEGETVSIVVKGPRSIVESLDASSFTATADLSHLSVTNSTNIIVKPNNIVDSRSRLLTITLLNEYVTLSIEEETEKSIPVKVITTGNVKSGHALGSAATSPNMITVKGPESVLTKIVEARAVVDVSNAEEDIVDTVKVGCIDGYGSAVQKDNVSLSIEKVRVSIPVYRTKTVPVVIKTQGSPKDNYSVRSINFEPSTVIITGENGKLAQIQSLEIDDIAVDGANSTIETNVAISDYLPSDVYIADDTTEIAVSVEIAKVITKEIQLNSSSITMNGKNSEYEYQIVRPISFKIKITGFQDELNNVSADTFNPRISLADMNPGEHEVPIVFDISDKFKISENYFVIVNITKPQ
ncbi:MAG: hypothetical protein J5517_06150 [Eubacterium sp.]|nr:hypothetical protein [Eubacterium sp.]